MVRYITSITFIVNSVIVIMIIGALTLMLVLDQKDALNLMENLDPLLLLIGLPLIPLSIVASRFIRWEDTILKLWRNYSRYLIGSQNCEIISNFNFS